MFGGQISARHIVYSKGGNFIVIIIHQDHGDVCLLETLNNPWARYTVYKDHGIYFPLTGQVFQVIAVRLLLGHIVQYQDLACAP